MRCGPHLDGVGDKPARHDAATGEGHGAGGKRRSPRGSSSLRAASPAVRDYLAARDGWVDVAAREDLLQDVLLRAWTHRRRFRGDSSAKTYLFAIARHVLNEHLRKSLRPGLVFPGDRLLAASGQGRWIPTERPEDQPPDSLHEALRRACAKLSPPQRQAIELDLFQDLPRAEAARLAGCTPIQLAKRLDRAKNRLRHLLGDTAPDSRLSRE